VVPGPVRRLLIPIKNASVGEIEQLEAILEDKPGESTDVVSPDAVAGGPFLLRPSFLQV